VGEYKTKGAGGGNSQSGAWNKWYRVGNQQQAWQGPTQAAFSNLWGPSCDGTAWSWCTEWGIGGNMYLALMPGQPNAGESYANGWSAGANWEITVRLAKARIAACGV
jgi:hypothetical protein